MAPLDDDEEDASDASAQADDEGSETGAPPSYLQHERAMLQRGLLASHQTGWSSSFDLEALCDRLHGLSVEEAEKDAREALREAKDEARDGDVLAILLQVFQSARSSVLDSEEDPTDYTWTEVLGYCSRLCALCDRNFLSLAGQPGPDDFPLRVVASVYAECGRTLSVASRPAEARNRLEKALNVFRLISEPTEEEAWLLAGCRASLARASRQLGQLKSAQDEFLQALQLMADLPEPRTGFGCLSASVCLCLCVEESSRGWRSCAFRFGNPERLDPAAKPRSKVAWTWFWDNTERMIKRQTANIKGYQRAADRFIRHLTDDVVTQMRKDVYKVFFGVAPKGQDYFKQSSTRLNFIADKVLEMSLEMYKRPRGMVEEISALGLRHVGYGIPTELFAPFIEAWSQVLQMMLVEEKAASSLRWSLTLISKILVRTILEGSTIVMKAINTNSAKRFRKAIAISGRSQRAMEMLRITVGTQSISPLDWAIKSGSFQVARAMIDDLLTIRADRDNYYYGYDALFERHPDILNILSATRGQGLLPALLNGLLWRSKVTQNKTRRVNYYVKHLIQDQEGLFNAKQISVIIKTGDPKLMRHPVVSFVFNMLWSRLASIEFLKSRVLFMIQVVIFVLAQSILPRVAPKRESEPLRILLFSCRCSIYLFDMFLLLCAHIKYIVTDIRERSFIFVLGIPCPAYLKDLASALQLAMVIDLVWRWGHSGLSEPMEGFQALHLFEQPSLGM